MTAPVDEANTPIFCQIPLPIGFCADDILEFHRRDPSGFAEKMHAGTLHKGISWHDRPARLTIRFKGHETIAVLSIDGPRIGNDAEVLETMLHRILGLTQRVEVFEEAYGGHPQLGPLIEQQRGLRVPVAATPFEALTWAVTGQQISVKAAVALRRKLIQTAGMEHSTGLFCYPDAGRIARLNLADLRQAGFSQAKAQTLLGLSRLVEEDRLPLDAWAKHMPPVDEIRERLLQVRGIGPWTVDYALLRGFGCLDGSLHGDAGVRRGLQLLLEATEKIGEQAARRWLAPFSPWRALVAAHLWALTTAGDRSITGLVFGRRTGRKSAGFP